MPEMEYTTQALQAQQAAAAARAAEARMRDEGTDVASPKEALEAEEEAEKAEMDAEKELHGDMKPAKSAKSEK